MKRTLIALFILSSFSSFAQTGTEIYLFDLTIDKGQVLLSNGLDITNHKGYDNQPSFHPSQPIIFYSSVNDSNRADIKSYNYHSRTTTSFTITREREYSPTVTPDGKFISCILQKDNGAQELVKYPIDGGRAQVLINHLKIGYHAWVGENKLLLFVLDDTSHFSLHYYNLSDDVDTVIAENIGRGLGKIPGQNAMSFIQKISDTLSVIKKFNLNTGVVTNIVYTLKGRDQFTWLRNNILVMSDGKNIYYYKDDPYVEFRDRKWRLATVRGNTSMFKDITRLATNTENNKLAVVVSE